MQDGVIPGIIGFIIIIIFGFSWYKSIGGVGCLSIIFSGIIIGIFVSIVRTNAIAILIGIIGFFLLAGILNKLFSYFEYKLNENNPEYYFRIGKACYKEQNYDSAESYFIKAINKKTDYHLAYMELISIYFIRKKYTEVEKTIKIAMKFQKDSLYYLLLSAVEISRLNIHKAIGILKEGLKEFPLNEKLHKKLGDIYLINEDYLMANNEYEQAVSLKITFVEAWQSLYKVREELKKDKYRKQYEEQSQENRWDNTYENEKQNKEEEKQQPQIGKNEECRSILNVGKDASQEEIKKAYRSMVKDYHPDLFRNQPEWVRTHSESMMKKINEAYSWLVDIAE